MRQNTLIAAVLVCISFLGFVVICSAEGSGSHYTNWFGNGAERIRCLYNGYFLTADPVLALDPDDQTNRYRLYVLNAILIDPASGRIAAVFPSLPGNPGSGGQIALPVSEYEGILDQENPPAPGVNIAEIIEYWRSEGVAESLLNGLYPIDLNGSVVTPGLIDDHFHVTSWSKKLPEPGETFGFWADVGDPAYYTDTSTWGRVCIRKALWSIVADANQHIANTGQNGIFLHGFWMTEIDDSDSGSGMPDTYLFNKGYDCTVNSYNPVYLLNRIGRGNGAPLKPPLEPCTSDPSTWPPVTYDVVPSVLVHTSGQSCWYNYRVLEMFNNFQRDYPGTRFETVSVISVTPSGGSGEEKWSVFLDSASSGTADILALNPPFSVDVIAFTDTPSKTIYVPLTITEVRPESYTLIATAYFQELAESTFFEPDNSIRMVPFYRTIDTCIPDEDWDAAAAYAGHSPGGGTCAWGDWDPRNPYETNWYNGAERGLIEYFHDETVGVWRPTGYAEHYVMRDALAYFVYESPTVEECKKHRRNLAKWCHRHGITAINDIMFYRRQNNKYEFEAYEALSYNHGMDEPFNLRVGLYYYLENADEISKILALANSPDTGYDSLRLCPDKNHPEYPGWVRWAGWKIQLDGGTGARTLFTSAPMAKSGIEDSFETMDEDGNELTFRNHSFGLLTMSNFQEQVFSSRQTAALYWLVRESDPQSPHYNDDMQNDWSFIRKGTLELMNHDLNLPALYDDLLRLDNVELTEAQALIFARKMDALTVQIDDGFDGTITAAAKIWYEKSMAQGAGFSIPSQTVTHCIGDGAVDLWVRVIKQLKYDIEHFPATWEELPVYWQKAIPSQADLTVVQRFFQNERFRVEHLLNFSCIAAADIKGSGGVDSQTDPNSRNIVFSTQPSLLALDGEAIKTNSFPYFQELWEIPDYLATNFWKGLSWRPRSHHHMPCTLFKDLDIPFTLDSDPPAVRDPRPVLSIIAAVARTPLEIDPTDWVGKTSSESWYKPPDYKVGKVHSALGLTLETPENPMRLSVEQALASMTFWAAYVSKFDSEIGAIAVPESRSDGWYADLVIWKSNPLGIRGPGGMSLEELGITREHVTPVERLATVNAFIEKFQPKFVIVGGQPQIEYGLRLEIPSWVHPGDEFFVSGYLDNPGSPRTEVPVFIVLDVYGELWFWPSWIYYTETEEIDYQMIDALTGSTFINIVSPFIWPETGAQEAGGLYFYGAILNSEMTDIEGNWAAVEWGYGP